MKLNKSYLYLMMGGAGLAMADSCTSAHHQKLPNILWLTCEDISPFLGCYGDSLAVTPNLDQFAEEAILFENAFSTAPVSGSSRSSIITGCYTNSIETDLMGCIRPMDETIRLFPEYLRNAGYYCTNNFKTKPSNPSSSYR